MSSQMVTVQRTDPDGTVHTYAWPRSLAEADGLTIIDEPAETRDGFRKPHVALPDVVLVTEPVPDATPAEIGKILPVTEPKTKTAGKPDVKED